MTAPLHSSKPASRPHAPKPAASKPAPKTEAAARPAMAGDQLALAQAASVHRENRTGVYEVKANSLRLRQGAVALVVDNLKKKEKFSVLKVSQKGWAFGFAVHGGKRRYGWVPMRADGKATMQFKKSAIAHRPSAAAVDKMSETHAGDKRYHIGYHTKTRDRAAFNKHRMSLNFTFPSPIKAGGQILSSAGGQPIHTFDKKTTLGVRMFTTDGDHALVRYRPEGEKPKWGYVKIEDLAKGSETRQKMKDVEHVLKNGVTEHEADAFKQKYPENGEQAWQKQLDYNVKAVKEGEMSPRMFKRLYEKRFHALIK